MEIAISTLIKSHLHNLAELVSFVVAILYYPYLKPSFMKWIVPFLGLIFLGEIIVAYRYYVIHAQSSIGIYYMITVTEFCFYGYIFYQLSSKPILKRIIYFFMSIVVFGHITSFVIYQVEPEHFLIDLVISGFLLTIVAISYIHELFVNDNNPSLIKEPGFWIAIGVSLFFSGTSIVFCLHRFILKNNLTLFGTRLYNLVPGILSVILYLCICKAIILCKGKTKLIVDI